MSKLPNAIWVHNRNYVVTHQGFRTSHRYMKFPKPWCVCGSGIVSEVFETHAEAIEYASNPRSAR